jgi:hypothetical protein
MIDLLLTRNIKLPSADSATPPGLKLERRIDTNAVAGRYNLRPRKIGKSSHAKPSRLPHPRTIGKSSTDPSEQTKGVITTTVLRSLLTEQQTKFQNFTLAQINPMKQRLEAVEKGFFANPVPATTSQQLQAFSRPNVPSSGTLPIPMSVQGEQLFFQFRNHVQPRTPLVHSHHHKRQKEF